MNQPAGLRLTCLVLISVDLEQHLCVYTCFFVVECCTLLEEYFNFTPHFLLALQ